MRREIDGLAPERPGVVDVYGLFLAGYAHQSVFLTEIEAGSSIFARAHGAEGRILRLANSIREPERHPLATRRNLRAALDALAARMDPEEDIALLYLTSHGSPDSLSLDFWQAGIRSLTAGEFAEALAESGLKNAVIVISACRSGSFIDDLEAPDRIIVTAASANRNSFGCADGNDWTWWGRAFFEEGLAVNRDFRVAFAAAEKAVAAWETAEGQRPSHPQMWVGEALGRRLDAMMAAGGVTLAQP
jgi:hypothetical protein